MPKHTTFKPFSTYVNGQRLGFAQTAKLTLSRNDRSTLEVIQLVGTPNTASENNLVVQNVIRDAFLNGLPVHVTCGVIGRSLCDMRHAEVIECDFSASLPEAPTTDGEHVIADDGIVGTTRGHVTINSADIEGAEYTTDHLSGTTRMRVLFRGIPSFVDDVASDG